MLVRRKVSNDPAVREPTRRFYHAGEVMRRRMGSTLQRLQRSADAGLRSLNFVPSRLAQELNDSLADVVHLHWIGIETMSIADIGAIEKPIVWTLHDMWAFCGAEHYATVESLARARDGYRAINRPRGHAGLDLDQWTWQRKKARWRPMHLVAPSRWLASCARESALARAWPIEVVANPVDTSLFQPRDRVEARRLFGLPAGSKIVLFGAAEGALDPRKGFRHLVNAMQAVSSPAGHRVLVAVFGGGKVEPAAFPGQEVRQLGRIDEEERLAALYCAADVFVAPSEADNFPNTVVEALSCGTPVVAFGVGGLPDMVEQKRQGYLAQPRDEADLAAGIRWVLYEADPGQLTRAARARASEISEPVLIAGKYEAVYRRALKLT